MQLIIVSDSPYLNELYLQSEQKKAFILYISAMLD